MDEKWTVTVWGTRGAIPMALTDYLEYGGSTSCTSVECGGELVVFDAGSGIVGLGNKLAKQSGAKKLHLFISHLHLDHIIGLTGFQTFYDPAAEIHLYGEERNGKDILHQLEEIYNPPYWPVGPSDFQAKLVVHSTAPGQRVHVAEGLTVDTLRANHPNLSLIYRLEGAGKRLVYILDCEMGGGMEERLVDFAKSSDLLIWDANFIPGELKPGWGHSTWEEGAALGAAAGVGTVLMTHFSHWYNDGVLRQQERKALEAGPAVRFAREGMELKL